MAKFKVGDVVEWKDSKGRHNSAYFVRENGDAITVSIEPNGRAGLEIPKEWITNSIRSRNAVIEKKLPPRGAGVYIEQQGGSFAVGPTDDGWSVANYGGEGVNFAHGFKTASEAKSWCASKGYKVEDVILANSLCSRNAVVQKAIARNGSDHLRKLEFMKDLRDRVIRGVSLDTLKKATAWPNWMDYTAYAMTVFLDKSAQEKDVNELLGTLKGIDHRFKRTTDRGIPVIQLMNSARGKSVVQKALNARWRIIYKNLSGPLFPYGKETYSTREEAEKRAEELRKQSREWGTNASYFVDEVGNSRPANADTSVLRETAVNASRSTNAVVAKALNARAVCNASYSAALKAIMDAVKPYMDRRITDDTSWRYPALVISKLRDVCERAVMSAGRYDGKRPPHRVYDVECVKDGFKFSGNLILSGLLHRDDPDDASAFDEYDMILSLGYAGKA